MNKTSLASHLDYLQIDQYLDSIFDAQSLAVAFDKGLIDYADRVADLTMDQVTLLLESDPEGARLILGLLVQNQVLKEQDGRYKLTPEFKDALAFRDLMLAKLQFLSFVANDFTGKFTQLICNPQQFFQQSNLFLLFDYSRALESSKENYAHTQRWVNLTTSLTKHEAPMCLQMHDFSKYHKALDYGGNSGEFALQLCRNNSDIKVTVLDLPVVCEVGQNHISSHPEKNRISFHPITVPELPDLDFDVIIFKSMLHDWPEPEVDGFLDRAIEMLAPDGTLIIFERGPVEYQRLKMHFSLIPVLLFFRSYRGPDFYRQALAARGFNEVEVKWVDLDMPFLQLTARRRR